MIWTILIPAIAVILHSVSIMAELLLHDREKAKDIRLKIGRYQRRVKELQKKKKDSPEMMKAQKELFSLMGQQMRLNFKPMLLSMPLFLIVFWLLNGMLIYQPVYADEPFELNYMFKNLDHNAEREISAVLTMEGKSFEKQVSLDEAGDEGEEQIVSWEITPTGAGEKEYSMEYSVEGAKVNLEQKILVVPEGNLGYQFIPEKIEPSKKREIEETELIVEPRYQNLVVAEIAGTRLTWFWYYIMSFFVVSLLFSPVKNKIIWGHWRGFKKIEQLELEKEKVKVKK